MSTHKRIAEITEELRALYRGTNDGPRLIAEMVEREFPKSMRHFVDTNEVERLEGEVSELESKLREVRSELSDANSEIDRLERDLDVANSRLEDGG